MLRSAGGDVLNVWPVSRQMNSSRNNGAKYLEGVGGRSSVTAGDGYLCVAEINTRADSDCGTAHATVMPDIGANPSFTH